MNFYCEKYFFLNYFSPDNKFPDKPIHTEPGDVAKKKSSVLKDDLAKGAAEHSLGSEVKAKNVVLHSQSLKKMNLKSLKAW